MSIELKLGADPEVFLKDSKGNPVSAHGKFPGTKAEPFKVEKGAIQVDGLALEFNIEPAKTAKEFSSNIEIVLKQMGEMTAKEGLSINFIPFTKFDVKYFKDEVPDEAKILGCDPDFSSKTGNEIKKVTDLTNLPFRTAAGHIHVGWTKDENPFNAVHMEDCRYIANVFYTKGNAIPGVKADINEQGLERQRLGYYGAYGAFRPKSYGVELRQFSNIWVKTPEYREYAFNYVHDIVQKLYKGE